MYAVSVLKRLVTWDIIDKNPPSLISKTFAEQYFLCGLWSTIIACVELLAGIIDMWHFVLFLLQLQYSPKSIPHIIHKLTEASSPSSQCKMSHISQIYPKCKMQNAKCHISCRYIHVKKLTSLEATPIWNYDRQFCTTPPVGILLGLRLKSLGWIPTVTIPNPVQPPLMILLTLPYFCTKRKLNKHVIATSSQQNPTNFFSFSFPFHLL